METLPIWIQEKVWREVFADVLEEIKNLTFIYDFLPNRPGDPLYRRVLKMTKDLSKYLRCDRNGKIFID